MMRKLILIIALAIVFPTFGQNSATKRVAILEPIDKTGTISYGVKLMIRSNLAQAITSTPGYEGYERVDMDRILVEHEFQRTGFVSDQQIKRLGEMSGAQYILITEIVKLGEQDLYVATKIVNVESANIEKVFNMQTAITAEAIRNMGECVSNELLSNKLSTDYSNQNKKIAILEVVDRAGEIDYSTKFIIRSNMLRTIAISPGYEGYDRIDVASVIQEHDFQRTGLVNDSQIRQLGEMSGAQYILVIEAAKITSQSMFLTAKILNVETAKIENTVTSESSFLYTDIQQVSASIAKQLVGLQTLDGGNLIISDAISDDDLRANADTARAKGDYHTAIKLLELSAEKHNSIISIYALIDIYSTGKIIEQDYDKVIKYIDKLLHITRRNGNYVKAMISQRVGYDKLAFNNQVANGGYGGHQGVLSRIDALKIYAAYPQVQELIGRYYVFIRMNYYDELDVTPFDKEAVRWYTKAAEAGSATAMYELANFYRIGLGVNKDMRLYQFWMQKSAANGYEKAVNALKKD